MYQYLGSPDLSRFGHFRSIKNEPSLDGLRAIAVTAVVLYHAGLPLVGGWSGVDVFFVLSGFLITRVLMREILVTSQINLANFYVRRSLRLIPAFWTMLLAYSVVVFITKLGGSHYKAVLSSLTYTMNWNRAYHLFPQAWLGHTWSLAVEEQFYLIWPFALLLILRSRRQLTWIALFIVLITTWRCYLVFRGADAERTYNGFDTHGDTILVGCFLSFLAIDADVKTAARRLVMLPLIAFAVILVAFRQDTILAQTAGLSLTSAISAWLIVAALERGAFCRLLSKPLFTYTGRISYGWYLYHYPLLIGGERFLPKWPGSNLFMAAFAYGIAALSFRYVELPFLRFKKKFAPERLDAAAQA